MYSVEASHRFVIQYLDLKCFFFLLFRSPVARAICHLSPFLPGCRSSVDRSIAPACLISPYRRLVVFRRVFRKGRRKRGASFSSPVRSRGQERERGASERASKACPGSFWFQRVGPSCPAKANLRFCISPCLHPPPPPTSTRAATTSTS